MDGHKKIEVDFKRKEWPSKEIIFNEGLFTPPEEWGTWSTGDNIKILFKQNLPANFIVKINARAFGPNVGKKFIIKAGKSESTFILSNEFQTISIPIDALTSTNLVEIKIPNPSSPLSLKLGDDNRLLGIALTTLQIEW